MTKHCILRCSGGTTLSLARSLEAAGYETWAPAEDQQRSRPRSSAKYMVTVPILPTFVFVAVGSTKAENMDRLTDLIALSNAYVSPHPGFTVFRYFGRYPLVADRTLDPLRVAERKGKPLEDVARFKVGDRVKHVGSGFDGLTGIVEVVKGKQGKLAMVCFPGLQIPIEISAWHLLPVHVEAAQP